MTVASRESADILRYDSAAYQRHKKEIDQMAQTAEDMRFLVGERKKQVFSESGVVCDRVEGDSKESVSGAYFSRARNLLNSESQSIEVSDLVKKQRALVESVLALRMSIIHEKAYPPDDIQPCTPFEVYRDLIRDFESHCKEHGIPSLIPNLFLPSSLAWQLRSQTAYTQETPAMDTMLEQLGDLCTYSPKHLHVVVHFLAKQKRFDQVLSLLAKASDLTRMSTVEICADNMPLLEAYIEALFAKGQHEKIVEEMSGCLAILPCRRILIGLYIQALIQTQRTDDFLKFMQSEVAIKSLQNTTLNPVVIDACADIGWMLYSVGQYQQVMDIVNILTSVDPRISSHQNIEPLIQATQQLLDPE